MGSEQSWQEHMPSCERLARGRSCPGVRDRRRLDNLIGPSPGCAQVLGPMVLRGAG